MEWSHSIKKSMDLIISAIGFALFFPLFPVISVLIKLESKGPVFFKQKRPGKNNKIFYLYKFRTMKELRDVQGNLLPDTPACRIFR
jgi:lipopolysaccharide/colanic/teichoic acid biosynthesis glycosyltransferase